MRELRKVSPFFLLMMLTVFLVSLISVEVILTDESYAQDDLFVYPMKGQSDEQLEKDKYDCYQWSKKETGFDPMQTPTATEAPPQEGAKKGGVAKGAVRGGLVGLGVGAIAGDAGEGAAIGAVAGGLFGGMRRQNQKQQQEQAEQQWAQEQAANYAQQRNSYNRAYAACLEARGYMVK